MGAGDSFFFDSDEDCSSSEDEEDDDEEEAFTWNTSSTPCANDEQGEIGEEDREEGEAIYHQTPDALFLRAYALENRTARGRRVWGPSFSGSSSSRSSSRSNSSSSSSASNSSTSFFSSDSNEEENDAEDNDAELGESLLLASDPFASSSPAQEEEEEEEEEETVQWQWRCEHRRLKWVCASPVGVQRRVLPVRVGAGGVGGASKRVRVGSSLRYTAFSA